MLDMYKSALNFHKYIGYLVNQSGTWPGSKPCFQVSIPGASSQLRSVRYSEPESTSESESLPCPPLALAPEASGSSSSSWWPRRRAAGTGRPSLSDLESDSEPGSWKRLLLLAVQPDSASHPTVIPNQDCHLDN